MVDPAFNDQPDTLTFGIAQVNVIRYSSEDVFIADGLKPGDKVVIAGGASYGPWGESEFEDKF